MDSCKKWLGIQCASKEGNTNLNTFERSWHRIPSSTFPRKMGEMCTLSDKSLYVNQDMACTDPQKRMIVERVWRMFFPIYEFFPLSIGQHFTHSCRADSPNSALSSLLANLLLHRCVCRQMPSVKEAARLYNFPQQYVCKPYHRFCAAASFLPLFDLLICSIVMFSLQMDTSA